MLSIQVYRFRFLFLSLFMIPFLLNGCSKENQSTILSESLHNKELLKKDIPLSFSGNEVTLPIRDIQGSFFGVSGWVDDQTLLYITETSEGASLFLYDLVNGKSTLLYSSIYPIVSVEISPSKENILIHSSPNSTLGLVTVITSTGKILVSTEIPSNELSIEWNEYNENILLITSFSEDWEYHTFKMDLTSKGLSQLNIPQPFSYWNGEKELIYLDWHTESPALSAPLKKYDIGSKTSNDEMEGVFSIDTVKKGVLTITVDQNEEGNQGIYTFLDQNFHEKSRLTLPQLSYFSGWYVPYYDYQISSNTFVTFKPRFSAELDSYDSDFQLIQYSIDNGKEDILVENIQNEPISCSPNGTMCLYGYNFEKLLILEKNEIVPLIQ